MQIENSDLEDASADGTAMALVIRLSGEAMALPVQSVNEIIDPLPRTRVPKASALAPWLINVRGTVVPLVDIRHRLCIEQTPSDAGRIVVLNRQNNDSGGQLALLVDGVDEVIDLQSAQIEALPEQGSPWPARYVRGACRRGEELILVLNPETLFRPDSGAELKS